MSGDYVHSILLASYVETSWFNSPPKFQGFPSTPLIVTQPDDPSDTVSLGRPEARGRFLVTPQTNSGVGSMYIIFY